MRARTLEDASTFLSATRDLLLADEARHNLLLGIAGTLRDHPGVYSEHRLWVVEDGSRVVAAALQTPPFNLVVAQPLAASALDELADALPDDLPGATGAVPEIDTFATAWEARTGMTRRRQMRQRVFSLTTLRPVGGVPGRPRPATMDDRSLLVEWVQAFAEEAVPDSPATASSMVDARLKEGTGGFLLWEDDGVVSLAGWGGLTPNGVRIGPVYTPREHRRRGYGSAVTAAVSANRLAEGRRFCFLYTDLDNPTSNKIYMEIGYEPVCDSLDYAFEPA